MVRSAETGIRESNKGSHVLYQGDTICSNLGHGCMADSRALYGSGLFPLLVSEDIANTVKMIHHGWNVYFSTQIKGNEETITSMQALKVRSYKFANGDLQWLRHFLGYIIQSKMLSFHQKIDVTALIGDTNIGGFLYVSVLIYNIIFPVFHGYVGSTAIFLIPLLFFLYSDTIIDIIYSLNCMSIWKTIKREFQVMITFSSTYYLCVKATFFQLLLHKSAKFKVTLKALIKLRYLKPFVIIRQRYYSRSLRLPTQYTLLVFLDG